MGSGPQENFQLRFKENPESIKVGDVLRYYNDDKEEYFINQSGFRIETIPVGARIKVFARPLGFLTSLSVPESTGVIVFKNSMTLFNLELNNNGFGEIQFQESKFFNGDDIEIISLP